MNRLWTKVFAVALAVGLLVLAGSFTRVSASPAAPAASQPVLAQDPQDENISITNEEREFDSAFDSMDAELDGLINDGAWHDVMEDSHIDNLQDAKDLDRNQRDGKPS